MSTAAAWGCALRGCKGIVAVTRSIWFQSSPIQKYRTVWLEGTFGGHILRGTSLISLRFFSGVSLLAPAASGSSL